MEHGSGKRTRGGVIVNNLHRFRFHPWHLATGLVLVCAVILAAAYWLRFNSGSSAGELAGFLPEEHATLLYIDVASLRAGGFLDLFSGSPAARDPEYRQFVSRTQFDYTTDLDALAASFRGRERFLVLRGRFNWQALISYVSQQGGSCGKSLCQLEGSVPDRRISFYPLRRDLMALAVSPDPLAAYQIRKGAQATLATFPPEPAWLMIPSTALQGAGAAPDRVRPFVEALRGAQQIEFAVSAVQKDLRISASIRCDSPASASQIAMELVSAQASLRDLILRQHLQPGPTDLAGILLNGSIRDDGTRVEGRWPVPHEFLAAVASGNAK